MANTKNRIVTLNNAGIDTNKFFSFNLPEGLKPGAVITLTINDDGEAVLADEIEKMIEEGGYIGNGRLFRRWVMAQTFHMLNWKSWDGERSGYDANLTARDYTYQFTMMLDEVHRLAKMEKTGGSDFEIQSSFFTKDVVFKVCDSFLWQFKKYVATLRTKKCKGVPYKHLRGKNVYVCDLPKLYSSIENSIYRIMTSKNYKELELALAVFVHDVKAYALPSDTPKSPEWKSAFKGIGGYYTLQNLIRFHGVRIHENGKVLSRAESEAYLERKRVEYTGEGYRLIGLLKEVVRYNNFDFNKRMAEIGR